MQHEDDFLTVLAKLSGAMDDKRRGHQALFLHVVMRVHPVRAGNRSIVIRLNSAVRDRRGLRPGEAVLRPRWKLPMPVDKGSCAGFVGKIHAESFACSKANTGTPVGACQPEDFGWSAVHFQHARSRDKTLGSRAEPRARHRVRRALRWQQAQCAEIGGERRACSRPCSFVVSAGTTGEQQHRQSNAQAQGRDDVDRVRNITLAIQIAIRDFIGEVARVTIATTSNASSVTATITSWVRDDPWRLAKSLPLSRSVVILRW